MPYGMGLGLLNSLSGVPQPPTPDEEAAAANVTVEQMLAQAAQRSAAAQQASQGALTELQGAETTPADAVSPLTAGISSTLARLATTIGGPGGPDYAAEAHQARATQNQLRRTERAENIKRLRTTYEQAAKAAQEAGDNEAEMKSRMAIQKLDTAEKKQLAQDKVAADKEAKTTEFGRDVEMEGIKHGYRMKEAALKAAKDANISPNEALKYLNTLTDNVRQDPELKDYAVIRDQLTTGRDAVKANDSAGDIILMRAIARATDPRTGVREEEYKTFASAQGALAARGVALTKGMIGKGKLSEFGRKSLMNRLESIHRRKKFQAKRSLNRFRLQAKEYKINPELALQAFEPEEESGEEGAATTTLKATHRYNPTTGQVEVIQ